MKFRTEIDIKPLGVELGYQSQIVALGSCFAESIGGRLRRSKFNIEVNPTGVLFNPASIAKMIRRFALRQYITAEELHEGAYGWFHYDFHSSLSHPTVEATVESINRAIDLSHDALLKADSIIITLGTAWIYELADGGGVVSNCHKQPASNFIRRRLSVEEVVDLLEGVITSELAHKRVILTLSPIRHLADGAADNSLSKATLRVAIAQIQERYVEQVSYFPSYEIMMDDLRDYRFYGEDMTHPSTMAIDYVWQLFCDVSLSKRAKELLKRVDGVVRATEHRVVNPQSPSHLRFCESQLRVIDELKGDVDMELERQYFEKGRE